MTKRQIRNATLDAAAAWTELTPRQQHGPAGTILAALVYCLLLGTVE